MRRKGDAPLPASAESLDALIAAQEGLEIDRLTGGFYILLPPAATSSFATKDPYRGKEFDRAAYVYAERDGYLRRAAVIHHSPDDRAWAQKLARLSARLLRLARDRFGRWPNFQGGGDEARVWLFRDPVGGAAGGETKGGQVYVYDTATITTPLEWVRTLCHEWGHLTLPAARGFTAPENDAGGMVGERLFIAWLAADKINGPDDGTRRPDLAMYCQRQCEPLIARFLTEGPASAGFQKRDARAMDLYVGAILSADRALGSKVLSEALRGIDGVTPKDFLDSLRNAAYLQKTVTVQLPAWVPLAPSGYRITPSKGAGLLLITGRPPLKVPGSLHPSRPAYALLKGSGSLTAITLTRSGAVS
ncbi:MAG: hypothetical protein QM758_29240 [Armatimonas sp.]